MPRGLNNTGTHGEAGNVKELPRSEDHTLICPESLGCYAVWFLSPVDMMTQVSLHNF